MKKRAICFLLIFVLMFGNLVIKAESEYDESIEMLIDYYSIEIGDYYVILKSELSLEIFVFKEELSINDGVVNTEVMYYYEEYGIYHNEVFYVLDGYLFNIIYNKGILNLEDNPYKEEVKNVIISDFFNFIKELAESFVGFFKEFIDSDYFLLYITLIIIMLVFGILAIALKG